MKKCSLIVPIMREIKQGKIPEEVKLADNGLPNFFNNITGLSLNKFDNVYFVFPPYLEKYIDIKLVENATDFYHPNFYFCKLDMTKSEPETIAKVIDSCNITGCVFIKDSDHYFEYDDKIDSNAVIVYPLEKIDTPIIPKNYSYVNLDDNLQMLNIIEKRVISNMFNCGGYIFEDASQFVDAYREIYKTDSKLYISHIIYYMMLNDNIKFKGLKANKYIE